MRRETLIWHLAQAQARLALSEKNLDRQRHIIDELDKVGHEAVTARALLIVFEATHALHLTDCQQIAAEIEALD